MRKRFATILVLLGIGSVQADYSITNITASVDNRDYTLTVASAYGTPLPAIGAHVSYCWHSVVTCQVDAVVSAYPFTFSCSGWTGTGSIPASGTTNNIGTVILSDINSSLTWLWHPTGDSDSDGMPDWWEHDHFGNDVNPNAMCSNGLNTALEAYIAGFDPKDPKAAFRTTFLRSPSDSVLGWNTISGRIYSVWWSTNLLNGFEHIRRKIPWTMNTFTDTVHGAGSRGFYKIEVQLEPQPPEGGDPLAYSWEVVSSRWIKNIYENGDTTMTDRSTGYMWLYNANPCGTKNWFAALSYCDALAYAGYSDWALPNHDVLTTQATQKSFFTNVQSSSSYWTSTSLGSPANYAYSVYMANPFGEDAYYKYTPIFVWPYRVIQ